MLARNSPVHLQKLGCILAASEPVMRRNIAIREFGLRRNEIGGVSRPASSLPEPQRERYAMDENSRSPRARRDHRRSVDDNSAIWGPPASDANRGSGNRAVPGEIDDLKLPTAATV
jgi:hypothetical protein